MELQHPEVYYVSFLILLYAGKTRSVNLNWYWLKYYIKCDSQVNKVTKFSLGQPAGNNLFSNEGTSETTRKNIEKALATKEKSSELLAASNPCNENIKLISDHVPIHTKPKSDEEFGHYLAGLIDGDGTFTKYAARIIFNGLDASLAYYIKGRLGYGIVTKVKSKNAVLLTITKREGLQEILNLVNGKLRTQSKLESVYNNIINLYKEPLCLKAKFQLNTSSDLNNHWLAGFLDADGSFQVKTLHRVNPSGSTRLEIRLNMQVDQKTRLLLDPIKNELGGNIGYRKSQDTYYYSSTSFGSAKKVIGYLDRYHVLSSKYLNYLKWRKVYILVQKNKHLTPEGQERIIKLKSSMNSYSRETLDL
jgi:hypothetical protein